MKKPQPKREMAIRAKDPVTRSIFFNASRDAAEELREYGCLSYDAAAGWHVLFVDARYDFDEVVAYIENYGQEASE